MSVAWDVCWGGCRSAKCCVSMCFGYDASTCHAKTTVDMPKGLLPSTCQTRLSPSTCQKVCSRRHAKQVCLRQHAKRLSVDMPKQCPIASQSLNPETSATRLARSTCTVFFDKASMLLTIYLAFYWAMSRL